MGEVIGGNYVSAYSGDQIDAILGKANAYPAASAGTEGQVPVIQSGVIGWADQSGGSDANLAPVEESSTASQAYAVNSFLIYNGQLYRVTAAITQGDALAVGTNIATADAATYLAMVASANAVASGGVAPGGFGLGEDIGYDNIDPDSMPANGYYYFRAGYTNSPPMGNSFGVQYMAGNATKFQIAVRGTAPGYIQVRQKIGGTWQPWEYVNPPLVAGTEYRTTERFAGKPVYTKLVDAGTTTASSSTQVNYAHGISNMNTPISCTGMVDNGSSRRTTPFGQTTIVQCYADQTNVMLTKVDSSWAGATWKAILKYTKTTD